MQGMREDAMTGFGLGLAQMLATIHHQPRRTMPAALWDRFVGLAAVRESFDANASVHQNPVVCGV